jgi:hypothetical protein
MEYGWAAANPGSGCRGAGQAFSKRGMIKEAV